MGEEMRMGEGRRAAEQARGARRRVRWLVVTCRSAVELSLSECESR